MNSKLFGTDGIRTRAGKFPLNAPAIVAIGQAIGERLEGTLLVGYDTRMSSPWILGLLKQGIGRTSAVMHDAGVMPTPGIALLVKTEAYSGGIMISASHNPFEDNGVKVFASDGTKLSDAAETEIEQRVFALLDEGNRGAFEHRDEIPETTVSGENTTDFPERYLRRLETHFRTGQWMQGLRIVVDCANGAMSRIAPGFLRRLGADLDVINAAPSGRNINAACGAVHMESLTAAMGRGEADFGVAFDGDGDRALFVSRKGRLIDGDAVLLLIARRLRPSKVVGTSMTNFALETILKKEGIGLMRVNVGDRFIFEEMQRHLNGSGTNGILGGEPSGHIIFSDFGLSGDGLLTALKVAEAIVETESSLDDLCRDWSPSPHLLKGVRVEKKIPLEQLPEVQFKISEIEEALTGCGRIVVRYSGTEPLLRIMIESDDAGRNEKWMEELTATIKKSLH